MDWKPYIEQKPDIMLGKPVIKGTRLTVELILEDLGEGATESDLLAAYPNLRSEHIKAVLAYANNFPSPIMLSGGNSSNINSINIL